MNERGAAGRTDILLVEDNELDLELTLRTLRSHRVAARIEVARDGEEALDFLRGTGAHARRAGAPVPRLVVMDLKLPKLDGIELLRRIKDDPQLCVIPVVVLTASDDPAELDRCYRIGANSCVPKPADFEAFWESIRQLGTYWLTVNAAPLVYGGDGR